MTTAEQFREHIEAFLKRSGMSATAFGKTALGDPSFVHDLRKGRSPNLGLVERVNQFIRDRDGAEPERAA